MGDTLSLVRAYGYKLKPIDEYDTRTLDLDESGDTDELLDRATGTSDRDYDTRRSAREALGVEFELYSWGDEMPYMLAVSESMNTVFDDGIMRVDSMPPIGLDWNARLDRVVGALGLSVDGSPGWYFLARYF